MGASETATFQVAVDARQGVRALDDLRTRSTTLGGGLDSLEKSVGKFQQTTLKSAAVMGQLGGAMGHTDGIAGKLLGTTGALAGSFAQGGAIGLGVTAITIGIGLAADKFDLFGKKSAEAAKKAAEHFDKLKGEIRDLDLALQAMATGTTIERIKQRAVVAEKEIAAKAAIEAVGGAERFARLAGYEAGGVSIPRQMQTAYEAAILATKDFALENDKLVKSIRNSQLEEHLKGETSAAARGAGRAKAAPAATPYGYGDGSAAESEAGLARGFALKQAEIAGMIEADRLEGQRQASNDRLGVARDEHAEKMRLLSAEAAATKTQQEQMTAAAVGLAAMTGRLAAGALAGQEDAFDTFIASASDMAGGFMMLEGGKLAAAGIASLGIGNPLGAGQLAGGLLLVAGGAAVQTGGPSAVSAIFGGRSSGGGGGSTRSDPGVNRGRGSSSSSGSSGGGHVSYIFNYGIAGPQPDETAREVARQLRRGQSRGFADTSISRGRG